MLDAKRCVLECLLNRANVCRIRGDKPRWHDERCWIRERLTNNDCHTLSCSLFQDGKNKV